MTKKSSPRQRAEAQRAVSLLVGAVMEEVIAGYSIGAIPWCQRFHPELVKELATIEGRANELAMDGNAEELKGVLASYRKHVQMMLIIFKAESEKEENAKKRSRF